MPRAQLIFVVTLVGACSSHAPPLLPAPILSAEMFACPPGAKAPAPPRLPRTQEQVNNWAWALKTSWARTTAARDECAESLAAIARATSSQQP